MISSAKTVLTWLSAPARMFPPTPQPVHGRGAENRAAKRQGRREAIGPTLGTDDPVADRIRTTGRPPGSGYRTLALDRY